MKKSIAKRLISTVLIVCVSLTMTVCIPVIGSGISGSDFATASAKSKTKKVLGLTCFKQDSVWFPKALGKSKLTNKQLRKLWKTKDLDNYQETINTVPDAVRFFRTNSFKFGSSKTMKKTLLKMNGAPYEVCQSFAYFLSDNMDETGIIRCKISKRNWIPLTYVKKNDTYYAIDSDATAYDECTWMGQCEKGSYHAATLSSLKSKLKKYYKHYGKIKSFEVEGYSPKTETILDTVCIEQDGLWFPNALGKGKLTTEQLKTFGKSDDIEYLRKEINTVSDALRFFRVNGYRFSDNNSMEDVLVSRIGTHQAAKKGFLFLLEDNYPSVGQIHCYCNNNYYGMCYIMEGGVYYAIDVDSVIGHNASNWMGFINNGKYVSNDFSVIEENLKQYCGYSGKIQTVETEHYQVNRVDSPEYTKAEIQALANAGLTLDEAADKISTISDAINYLIACGYTVGKFKHNPGMRYKGIEWGWGLSADFTYRHMAGSCAGTSNLFNRLLKDDFDDAGYVELRTTEGGHVFNYFMRDGIYYFCDFAGWPFTDDPYGYLEYKTDDPASFGEYYITTNPGFYDVKSDWYLLNLYMYSRNGENKLPCGFDPNAKQRKLNGDPYDDKYPDTIENLRILFLRDGYTMSPAQAPAEEEMPPETHIPDEDGNYYD